MTVQEQVVEQLSGLDVEQLVQVAEYVALLKRRRGKTLPPSQWAAAYAESAGEDRELAEQGLSDYAAALGHEDVE